ncbi:MAG: thiamine-monophosphate kinase [Actinomycetota bacterium]|nr:thiamine-monophosphate kinase [Actinomycetota bacterium]
MDERGGDRGLTLADVGEDGLLSVIFPLLPGGPEVLIGPGDDTALLRTPGGSVLATTDAMVRGHDWLDRWSTGADVGAKAVAQNIADIAAMGGVPSGLLVTLIADPRTSLAWVRDFTTGLAAAAEEAGVAVLGGDLSSAPEGVLVVSVTALGACEGTEPVCRSGAQAGDVLAVCGSLGHSAAGMVLLQRGQRELAPELVSYHCRPRPPHEQGPVAARAGATAMLDISDGLGRDAGRIARASGVGILLDEELLRDDVMELQPVLSQDEAWRCVTEGGEEHSLLACFPTGVPLPGGWRRIGAAVAGSGVSLCGQLVIGGGWDHFGG